MPSTVALSQWMGVGGCGWPSYVNVIIMVRTYFTFINSAPNSASAADYDTHFKIL